MLEHGISADLKTSAIVPLPKKGDLSDTNNWRGICLMPHITKLFDKLLLHRIRDAIDESLECTQNGFRPGRGTAQHAAAFRLLVERAQATKAPMHGCFVDFSKAFDSVRWDAILERLRYWGAPQDLVNGVFSVMIGHTLAVRCDGELGPAIPISLGVLQGDTLAPLLFIMVLDKVLKELPDCGFLISPPAPYRTKRQQKLPQTYVETRISNLAYADDVCLFAHNSHDLQRLLTAFASKAEGIGLKLNMGKGKTERHQRHSGHGKEPPGHQHPHH
eukprot:PhM_4_TR11636/c6_g1_i2/m.6168